MGLKLLKVTESKKENRIADTKPAREYIVLQFKSKSGAFDDSTALSRVIWQVYGPGGEPMWTVDPKEIVAMVGKEVPGEIITVNHKPYQDTINGVSFIRSNTRLIVLQHELNSKEALIANVKRQAEIQAEAQGVPAQEPVGAEAALENQVV